MFVPRGAHAEKRTIPAKPCRRKVTLPMSTDVPGLCHWCNRHFGVLFFPRFFPFFLPSWFDLVVRLPTQRFFFPFICVRFRGRPSIILFPHLWSQRWFACVWRRRKQEDAEEVEGRSLASLAYACQPRLSNFLCRISDSLPTSDIFSPTKSQIT